MHLLRLLAVLVFAAAAAPVLGQEERQAFVTADVDVYDAPFGLGNILGFVGAGNEVRTWPADCVDGWCPIAGETIPRGFGWIWSDFLAPGASAERSAGGPDTPLRASYTGTWSTTTGGGNSYTLELTELDGVVAGTYAPANGSMAGHIDGEGRLIYQWQQDGDFSGMGVFTLSGDGQRLEGTFSTTKDPFEVSGTWTGVRTGVP